jgi:hypothetical protein
MVRLTVVQKGMKEVGERYRRLDQVTALGSSLDREVTVPEGRLPKLL